MPKNADIPISDDKPINETTPIEEPKYPEAPCDIYYQDKVVGRAERIKLMGKENGMPLFSIAGEITDEKAEAIFSKKHRITAENGKLYVLD